MDSELVVDVIVTDERGQTCHGLLLFVATGARPFLKSKDCWYCKISIVDVIVNVGLLHIFDELFHLTWINSDYEVVSDGLA